MTERPLVFRLAAARAARTRRLRLVRRAAGLALGAAILGATVVARPAPRLVWNASASAPIGFYVITYRSAIRRGSMVLARLPMPVRRFAAERHYLPFNVPLVKHVAGVVGDRICARGATIFRDGEPIAARKVRDMHGRPLPSWHGCRRLRDGELFLLNAPADSFDGRYFGVTTSADVIGKAHKL